MFEVRYYPQPDAAGMAMTKDEDEAPDPLERSMDYLDKVFGYYEIEKEGKTSIAGAKARELHIAPSNNEYLRVYVALVEQDDGVYLFEGISIENRYKKNVSDFSKAARSFKRVEKEDRAAHDAELEQMSEQERFLQKQVDKLPPGWDHLRTARYLFLFNADKGFVKEMADQIEGIRDAYEEIYPPTRPIEAVSIVRVCNSRDEYTGYGGPPTSGGYWSSFHKELVMFDQRPRADTLAVMNHEALHQYIYYFYGELSPHSWYNEGHGDYFGGARLTRSFRVTGYGDLPGGYARADFAKEMVRLARQGKRLDEGAAAPLEELLRYRQPQYYNHHGDSLPVAYYPQGWSFVHMLREGKALEPKWKAILPDYLDALLEARHETAEKLMQELLVKAEKKEKGSSEEMSKDPKDYYGRVDTDDVQDLAYEKTFEGWTNEDWKRLDEAYWDYVEKL
jgi:hypothetical protein